MAKLLGALLILSSTTYVGYRVAGNYARRTRQLRALQTALAILQTEIDYGSTPLPDALMAVANTIGRPIGTIFLVTAQRLLAGGGVTPGEALTAALAQVGGETALRAEDLAVLQALGSVLGSSGRADQMRHLTLARERLAGAEAVAREEGTRYEPVARYMGVLSGALLVLILL